MDYALALVTRWKPNDIKAALLASAKRAQLGRNKVLVQQKKIEKEIAEYLQQGRNEKARIKAESLVHMQKMETAYDILETLLELIQTRLQYITESKECPPDLVTPVASVIYASKRLQIPEFKTALRQLNAKYGVGFTHSHADNESGQVASNLVDVLLITPVKEGEIHDLLVYIAETHNIDWIPPRRPETMGERNMDANPLLGSSAVAIAAPVVAAIDTTPSVASVPPAPAPEVKKQADPEIPKPAETLAPPPTDSLDLPPAPLSPADDPQYDQLLERLRKLKIDTPKAGGDDSTKPSL